MSNSKELENFVSTKGVVGFKIEESVQYDSSEIEDATGIALPDNSDYLVHIGNDANGYSVMLVTEDYPSYNPMILVIETADGNQITRL